MQRYYSSGARVVFVYVVVLVSSLYFADTSYSRSFLYAALSSTFIWAGTWVFSCIWATRSYRVTRTMTDEEEESAMKDALTISFSVIVPAATLAAATFVGLLVVYLIDDSFVPMISALVAVALLSVSAYNTHRDYGGQ